MAKGPALQIDPEDNEVKQLLQSLLRTLEEGAKEDAALVPVHEQAQIVINALLNSNGGPVRTHRIHLAQTERRRAVAEALERACDLIADINGVMTIPGK